MKRLFKCFALLFLCFHTSIAQEGLKKSATDSTNTPVASSISYTVKKGDTKFSLAKHFGLTISALESQNPEIIQGLNVGSVLEVYPGISYLSSSNTTLNTQQTNDNSPNGKRHVVRSGETLFRIASANGLTVKQLEQANSKVLSRGLIAGQILWIPDANQINTTGVSESYVVKNGDTKFGLSRRFNTTIRELEHHNPHIKNVLEIGHLITMPSDGESTSSIAKVAPTEAPKENRNEEVPSKPEPTLTKPVIPTEEKPKVIETPVTNTVAEFAPEKQPIVDKKKDDLTIATPKKSEEKVETPVPTVITTENTVQTATESLPTPDVVRDFSIPVDLRTTANTSQFKKLLFFLPFSQMEYQSHQANNYDFNAVTDNFERAHLEFYQGANIAIDSIRKMYLTLDVDILKAPNGLRSSKIEALLEEGHLTDYDAIILPFYGNLENEVAAFTANCNIPVITASTMTSRSTTNNLFSAVPSTEQQRKKVLDYMIGKKSHIIVLNDVDRSESKAYISGYAANTDFVTIKKNGSFSESELIGKLKKDRLNFVVIDSERNSVFLNTTNVLLSQLSNYDLQLAVLESALIPDEGAVSEKRFRILNMVFPSLIPAKSTANSKQFLSSYQQKYNLLPSANVMLGFDITFDSLLRMLQKQGFENSAVNDITEYTQLKFDYEKNILGSYNNDGIYILQYDSDANIREAN